MSNRAQSRSGCSRRIRRWPIWIITIQGEQRDGLHCIGISEHSGSRGRTAPAAGCKQARRKEKKTMNTRKYTGLDAPSWLPKPLADAWAEFAAWSATEPFDHPSGRQVDVEPDPNAHQKRLAGKAAYNKRRSADGAFRKKERKRRKKWGRNNRDKIRAQKAKSRERNYLRPFVAIDSEGGTTHTFGAPPRTMAARPCGSQPPRPTAWTSAL
jgi:hypothetical protein